MAESDPLAESGRWREVCSRCGRTWSLADRRFACRCGGLLDLVGPVADPLAHATGEPAGSYLARYRSSLPPGGASVDMDAAVTPALQIDPGMWVKVDYEQPTGSFKDRGAAVMVGVAAASGVRSLLVDSSGNAGRAVAAFAARAGLAATVYLPAGTAAGKVSAIAAFGAEVVDVPGGREGAAAAALEAAGRPGTGFYASHVYQPSFHHGVKTLAFELFEQVPGMNRATVIVPAGNGTLVLGLWLGFGDLMAAGRMDRRPAIVAVQAENCAPLTGRKPAGPREAARSAAAGISIARPPRAGQVRGAAVGSGGAVVAVTEEAIAAAVADLHERGLPVEPTGAVAWAAVRSGLAPAPVREPGGPVVAVLTGREGWRGADPV